MALYKGFVEVDAGGPVRRYLLDLDISVILGGGAVPLNPVDVDGAAPMPDLTVRTTVHRIDAADTYLEIQLRPFQGRTLLGTTVRVFFNTDTIPGELIPPPLFPVDGAFPTPSHWVYVAYEGQPGQAMPELTFHLSQRSFPAEGAADGDPLARDDVDIVVTSPQVTGPLHLAGGMLEGPLDLLRARPPLVQAANGSWGEDALGEVDIRGIGLDAPVLRKADLAVSTPGQPTFPLECLWVGIATDHLIDAPAAPTVARVAGAGGVDAGRHRYKASYVLANGNETKVGPPSDAVEIVDPAVQGRVEVDLPVGPPPPAPPETEDPGLAVVARRVYRTLAGPTGDDGEYLLVGEVAGNAAGTFTDDRPDSSLTEPTADRLVVHYSSVLRHDIEGTITLRDQGVDPADPADDAFDEYEAVIRNAPTDARVTYRLRPPSGRSRVVWQAAETTDHLEVRVPTLASGQYVWCEVRADDVPQVLGGHWFLRGPDRVLVEVGDATRDRPIPGQLGRVQVVLASQPGRPWRDAPQPVAAELVETWFAPGRLDKARLLVALSDLRRVRFDLGLTEGGPARHARPGEGVVFDLELGPRPGGPLTHRFPVRPGRPLRGLVRLRTYDVDGVLSHSHASVRVGDVPRSLHLDLRASGADAEGGEYFGAHLAGGLRNAKVLWLEDPTEGRSAYAADALRIWAAVPQTGEEVEVVRADGDVVVRTDALTAEASARHPGGLTAAEPGDDEPFRHVKGLLEVPGTVRVGAAVAARGTARAGTTADTLVDGHVAFDPAWSTGQVRYLSGTQAGTTRPVTAVAADGSSVTTDAFPAAPAPGDTYEIVLPDADGLSFVTARDGRGVTGRVAVSKDLDRLVAAGATPQVRLRTAPVGAGPEPQLRALSARAYGLQAAGFSSSADGRLAVPVTLDPDRVNRAFRAELRELDGRFAPEERDMVKGRLEDVPDDLALRVHAGNQQFEWRAVARSGRAVFHAEPGQLRGPDAGVRAGAPAGIGLVEGEVDGLPRWVRLTVLPSAALPAAELVPRNFTPPSDWNTTGFKAEVSEAAGIEFLRMITWSRDDRDDQNRIHWGHLAATFLRWEQENPPIDPDPAVLTPLWIWMFGEADPADEDEPQSGLGYRITPPGAAPRGVTLTLDLDQAGLVVSDPFVHWRDLGGFTVGQELQMRDYAGEVSISASEDGIAGGDDGAGPGEWFLRIIDGRPWYVGWGSAYFGNTGAGSPFTLPRIFT